MFGPRLVSTKSQALASLEKVSCHCCLSTGLCNRWPFLAYSELKLEGVPVLSLSYCYVVLLILPVFNKYCKDSEEMPCRLLIASV